jgi:hypothetical protein
LFEFAPVENRAVVASFDGGRITTDAGALLLGAADRVIALTRRFAACFTDRRNGDFVEHSVQTLVTQRIVGIALGYEDLIDHDELRHDPVMAVLAGKLAASRSDCAPLAGKSTLNRLELSRAEPTRYTKIAADTGAIEALLVDLFLDAHAKAPRQITLDLDATDDPLHGHQEGRFFHGYYDTEAAAQSLYETIYCARGEMENRIKECQLDLFADRTSAATMRANQLRLWFASLAYVLMCALRRIGLAHTQFANATCGTIRLKLLKIGAPVRTSVRRVAIAMASACPWQHEFALAHALLRRAGA